MSIPNHILEQLNSQADLISIIGRHTTLKRAGSEFKGCCPFHGEKSPSFYVNPQKNIYHCFGCSVGGNAISFLRDYENLTFIEAVNELSKQTGIEVPKEEQQNVSYQRTKKQAAIKPASRAPAAETAKFQPAVDNQLPASIATDSQQKNYTDQPTYNDHNNHDSSYDHNYENSYDSYPPLDAYDSAPYPMDSYPADYQDATNNGAPPAWLTDTNAGAGSHSDNSVSDKDGNLYDLLEQIQQFYQHNLTIHPHAKHYFLSRGITEDIFETFGLGYAPFGWQHLEHQFPQDIEGLKALG
jgi:DNA primase